jgi:hypothetical protein
MIIAVSGFSVKPQRWVWWRPVHRPTSYTDAAAMTKM